MDSSASLVDTSDVLADSSTISTWRLPPGFVGARSLEWDLVNVVRFSAPRQLVSELRQFSDDSRRRWWIARSFYKDGHCSKEGQHHQIYLGSYGPSDRKDISQDWWSKSDRWNIPKRIWSSIISTTTTSTTTTSTTSTSATTTSTAKVFSTTSSIQWIFLQGGIEVSSITTLISKIIMKMKRCSMVRDGGSLILTLIKKMDFRTLIGEAGFLVLSVTKEDTQTLISLGSLLLMRILVLNHPYFGLIKLISYFIWSIFSWKIMSSLWLINLKEEQRHGGTNCKTSVNAKANHP